MGLLGVHLRGTYDFQQFMQGLQSSNHTFWILVIEEQSRGFFKTFVPQLVPQYSHANEFMAHHKSLSYAMNTWTPPETNILTCSTMMGECSLILSIILRAAFFREILEDFEATVRGYISA